MKKNIQALEDSLLKNDTDNLAVTPEKQTWVLTKLALSVSRPIGSLSALFGFVVLAGYFGNVEALYRPISGGPATNPLTATVVMLIGLGLGIGTLRHGPWLQRIASIAALVATGSRLLDAAVGTSIAMTLTPFHDLVVTDLAMGKSNAMGVNSATMLFLVSLSVLFHSFKLELTAQITGFLALAIPLISFTGYAYGFDQFYGQMSLITATAGIFLSSSALFTTAKRGALRAVLSPYIGGRIARLQITLGILVPFTLGFLVVKALVETSVGNPFGAFVVGISWFIITLVCISAVIQERADQQRRRAERKLLLSARTDPLTGLPNRRTFFHDGEREMIRAHRTKNVLSVLMLDIDHFKKVNDTAGHAMGDRILIEIGNQLSHSVRAVDLVARLGGEEFAILLADTDIESAKRVGEKIRRQIEELEVEGWTDIYGPITISIGCTHSSNHTDLDHVLSIADEALYEAKSTGRNRVAVAKTSWEGSKAAS